MISTVEDMLTTMSKIPLNADIFYIFLLHLENTKTSHKIAYKYINENFIRSKKDVC
jgi:hypothetical protein